jgi:hypothetical protein
MSRYFVVLGQNATVPNLAGGSRVYLRGDVFSVPDKKAMKDAPQANREAIERMIERFMYEKTPPVIREATEEERELVKVTLVGQADVTGTLERNLDEANKTINALREIITELRQKISDLEYNANQPRIAADQQRQIGLIETGVKEANRTVLEASVKASQGSTTTAPAFSVTEQELTDGNQTEQELKAAKVDDDTLPLDFPARDAYLASDLNTLSKLRAASPKDWRGIKGVTEKLAKDTEAYLLKMVR